MANSNLDLSDEEILQLENALEAAEDDPRFLNGGDLVNLIHIILKRFAPTGYEPRQANFPEVLTSKKAAAAKADPKPGPEAAAKESTKTGSGKASSSKPKSAAERALTAAKD